jgi:negative regulator of genetic competence, sporulation and motility
LSCAIRHALKDSVSNASSSESSEKSANKQTVKKTRSGGPTFAQAFIFKNVDEVITFSKLVDETLPMESILYKNEKNGEYILLLMTKTMLAEDFGMVCSIANEYATMLYMIPSTLEYFKEHYKLVIAKDTIKKLKQV